MQMAVRRKKYYDSYRYSNPVPAAPGKHGRLCARIHRVPEGWTWELKEDDCPFKSGTNIGLEDARSEAIHYLKDMLMEKGEPDRFFSVDPNTWLGQDDPKGRLGDRIKSQRSKGLGDRVRSRKA